MTDVIKQRGSFYIISINYTSTDSLYIHKKYWSDLVENGLFGQCLDLGKYEYGNSGKLYA